MKWLLILLLLLFFFCFLFTPLQIWDSFRNSMKLTHFNSYFIHIMASCICSLSSIHFFAMDLVMQTTRGPILNLESIFQHQIKYEQAQAIAQSRSKMIVRNLINIVKLHCMLSKDTREIRVTCNWATLMGTLQWQHPCHRRSTYYYLVVEHSATYN